MKNFLYIFLIFVCLLFCGCENKKKFIIFSTQPITQENTNFFARNFNTNERIYFMVINPKGFKKGIYRAMFIKKDDKSEFWGYKYYRTYDFKVEKDGTKYVSDYIVIHEKGWYALEFFNMNNINKLLVIGDIHVHK